MKQYALLGLAALAVPVAIQGVSVSLQATTPGVAEVGHSNITGTAIAGKVQATSALLLDPSVSGLIKVGSFRTGSSSGTGVWGEAFSTTGTTYGGEFFSKSTIGMGVRGVQTHPSGTTWGGSFEAYSTAGTGVRGQSYATSGATSGGYFEDRSTSGRAVFAKATATTGSNTGVYGESLSTSGKGVYGRTTAASGSTYAGYFLANSTSGRAVYGWANAATGTTYGVTGRARIGIGAYGVYSLGNTGASGTKSFRIDHPSDPENKYLLHYSAESPSPQNFYVGNVVTDAKGYAWVTLPDYFGDINTSFKYQLTVVSGGRDFVQAMVSREIQANRFQVRTSAPNVKVSWEVKADRNDAFVRESAPKDVVEKDEAEKGTYQHPEFFGFGPERAVDFDGGRQGQRSPTPSSKH